MSTLAEQMIEHYKDRFDAAEQRRSSTVFTVAGRIGVAQPGEKVLYLPNGTAVKVTTDASGTATQIEEDEALHAIVRPAGHRLTRHHPRIPGIAVRRHSSARPLPVITRSRSTRPGG